MEFWVLTILASISLIYCCDLPLIINIPFMVNNHNSLIYGIGQSIIAAYIFYFVQIVIMNKVRLIEFRDIAYIEIGKIEERMNDVIVLLSGKGIYEDFSIYSEEKIRSYLHSTDIFHRGSRQDKCMKEMTILEALINDFEIIDEHINNLLLHNLIDGKKKKVFQDIKYASLKETVKSLKENEPGYIENAKYRNGSEIRISTSVRVVNFEGYINGIVLELQSYGKLFAKLRKIQQRMYPS